VCDKGKGKGKVVPLHTIKAYGEWRYSTTHSKPQHYTEVSSRLCACSCACVYV